VPDTALWSAIEAFENAITVDAPHLETRKVRLPPNWAACGGCHDSEVAAAHFNANVAITRGGEHVETCTICHGPGRLVDVDVVHGLSR
jgi:hypothetical protein